MYGNIAFEVLVIVVTPKGELQPEKCSSGATREGPWASSRKHLPKQK